MSRRGKFKTALWRSAEDGAPSREAPPEPRGSALEKALQRKQKRRKSKMSKEEFKNLPEGIEYWTADMVAECLPYQEFLPKDYGPWETLYHKLWSFLEEAENPTPLGGDGSNGTVEEPCGRRDLKNDDKTSHWWMRLSLEERKAIKLAWQYEFSKYENSKGGK